MTDKDNRLVAKAIVVKSQEARERSHAFPEDPFIEMYGTGGAIEPPFNLFVLANMPESCGELGPAINAMCINIEALGHRIIVRDGIGERRAATDPEILAELSKVSNFFANAVLEPTETLTTLRKNVRTDLESTGNAYIEVLPLVDSGEPAGLKHLPSWTMRLRRQDAEWTNHDVARAVRNPEGLWEIKEFPYSKQFRRFIQLKESTGEMVYFKEWGDPRPIDSRTGEVADEETMARDDWSDSFLATPVIHLKLYSPRSPYGLPRWIGNLFTIYGNRSAEIINYTTFSNNNIPALMLMATNVQLTDGSIERIQEFINERVRGNTNYATILIVEGEPLSEGLKDPGTMKLDLKELTNVQHTDALFVNYMERADDKIRRSFRIPPIFMGRAEDYTRATADSSKRVGEEQVFRPERDDIDMIFNQTIVPALGAASVVFRSNTPNVTDNYELTQLLAVAERSGGLTPTISRLVVEDVLGRDLPEVSPQIDPEIPFSLTTIRERAKAEAFTARASNPEFAARAGGGLLDDMRELREMVPEDGASQPLEATIRLLESQERSHDDGN